MIFSIASNESSIVSNGTYNILPTSTPTALRNSSLSAFSVSIYTASPPFFCVLASVCATIKLLPDASIPCSSTIRPTGNPPFGRFDIARSSIEDPVEIHSVKSVGASSSPFKKWAALKSLNFLFKLSANSEASSSLPDIESGVTFCFAMWFMN